VKRKAVIFDLDGTLCNYNHRRPLITGSKKDWDAFLSACDKDTPNRWAVKLVQMYSYPPAGYRIMFVTGRGREYEEKTRAWIYSYLGWGRLQNRYALYMRPEKDSRPDDEIKKEIYLRDIEPFFDVEVVIDDRTREVKMWRSLGLTCLQCDDGNF
jgi:phosphoglycolate phosphatase-like HAD superfamily hydrolase